MKEITPIHNNVLQKRREGWWGGAGGRGAGGDDGAELTLTIGPCLPGKGK